jgi:hypothetical protein
MAEPAFVSRVLRIHRALRRDATRLPAAFARAIDDEERTVALRRAWEIVGGALHFHHVSEEEHMFPALVAMDAAIADRVAALGDDHAALDPLVKRIEAALAALPHVDGARAGEAAARELAALLDRHLAAEEGLLPWIERLDGGEEGERRPAPSPMIMAWVVDGASDDDVAAFSVGLPAPILAALPGWREEYARSVAVCWS